MNLREEFKEETNRSCWIEGVDYGSFDDEYVRWLEDKHFTIPEEFPHGAEMNNKLLNWSEVSRVITGGDRQNIRPGYSGKKYARQVKWLIRLIKFWIKMVDDN